MNLQQLQYVVEVEKYNSITKAAKNLFMGQPNLSKALKELETELGITLFKRTTKGVVSTEDGKQFLKYATNILAQITEIENYYKLSATSKIKLTLSAPRATYISNAFSTFLNELVNNTISPENSLDIHYKETSSTIAIDDVATGESSIGIIRYPKIYEQYFISMLKKNNLDYELLSQFDMDILVHKDHPLAKFDVIPFNKLDDCIELRHGDYKEPKLTLHPLLDHPTTLLKQKYICIYDRSSQFDILEKVTGTYLWASPIPTEILDRYHLVSKPCNLKAHTVDLLIYSNKDNLTSTELDLISRLKEEISSYGVFG